MIKAIIFDCFGVLLSEAWEPFCDEYFGKATSKREQASELGKQLNLGVISYDQFIDRAAKLAGVNREVAQAYIDASKPNKPLFDYIYKLKSRYKIGMLSNSGDNWLEQLFSSAQLALFDSTVLSYEYGFVKPQPEIYAISLQQLQVQPSEAIFVDDIPRYCDAAEKLGVHAVCFHNFEQMKREIEQILSHA